KNLLNQQRTLTEDEFYQYEDFLREKLYQQINYIFIALETRKCTIIEKKYLIEQIPLLSQLLFDFLNGENEDYWRVTQQQSWDFFNYDYTFIQPKDFTKEYINQQIKSFNLQPLSQYNKENKNDEEQDWYIVAFEFANGNIYE